MASDELLSPLATKLAPTPSAGHVLQQRSVFKTHDDNATVAPWCDAQDSDQLISGLDLALVTAIAPPHRGQVAPQTIGVRSPIGRRGGLMGYSSYLSW